jgi:hypothetical protein
MNDELITATLLFYLYRYYSKLAFSQSKQSL